MLYRLMKVSRREKGFDDVSDLETVSVVTTPTFPKTASHYDSPFKASRPPPSLTPGFSTAAQSRKTSPAKARPQTQQPLLSSGAKLKRKLSQGGRTCFSSCKQRCSAIPRFFSKPRFSQANAGANPWTQ